MDTSNPPNWVPSKGTLFFLFIILFFPRTYLMSPGDLSGDPKKTVEFIILGMIIVGFIGGIWMGIKALKMFYDFGSSTLLFDRDNR